QFRVRPNRLENVQTADLRHHDSEDDDIRLFAADGVQRQCRIGHGDEVRVAGDLEIFARNFDVDRLVVDDHHARMKRRVDGRPGGRAALEIPGHRVQLHDIFLGPLFYFRAISAVASLVSGLSAAGRATRAASSCNSLMPAAISSNCSCLAACSSWRAGLVKSLKPALPPEPSSQWASWATFVNSLCSQADCISV